MLETLLKQAEQRIATARAGVQAARKQLAEVEKNPPREPVVKTEPMAKPAPALSAKVLLRDDFAGPKPELWETVGGKWRHQGGKLLQEVEGVVRSVLKARTQPPRDFQARFKLAITGGEPWRSVGIAFDLAGTNEVMVYVSAYAGGPKLQVSYKQGGNVVYPADGMQNRPVKLKEPLELTLRVRDTLVNVAINGEHALAYRLPLPRREGGLQLITYAATAEFLAFELATLPGDVKLTEAGKPAAANTAPMTVDQARAALAVAEKALAAAAARPGMLRAPWPRTGLASSSRPRPMPLSSLGRRHGCNAWQNWPGSTRTWPVPSWNGCAPRNRQGRRGAETHCGARCTRSSSQGRSGAGGDVCFHQRRAQDARK